MDCSAENCTTPSWRFSSCSVESMSPDAAWSKTSEEFAHHVAPRSRPGCGIAVSIATGSSCSSSDSSRSSPQPPAWSSLSSRSSSFSPQAGCSGSLSMLLNSASSSSCTSTSGSPFASSSITRSNTERGISSIGHSDSSFTGAGGARSSSGALTSGTAI